ncbi:MAG TPA: CHAD domain-containing protein [Gemmatimonadaceae bacterium]|jgi:CHAD domain-containing protein/CYTH domain-containing protein
MIVMTMRTKPDLLEQPVERAARLVALRLLDNAAKARKRLDGDADADALHDFRVAIRRLRSWLRALGPWLEKSVPKKARRRLEKAAHLTGDSRDAEVHLEWLREQRAALSARQRRGLNWLIEQIETAKKDNDRAVFTKSANAFDRARSSLSDNLPVYSAHVDSHKEASRRQFSAVMAELLHDHVAVLAERLTRVEAFEDEKGAHAARIAGKRLRYLLEPIAEHVEGGADLVSDLSKLQDTFGSWHDVHVFSNTIVRASEDAAAEEGRNVSEAVVEGEDARRALRTDRQHQIRLGLLALAGRLHERGQEAYADAKDRWLNAGPSFVERVESVSQSLMAHASRGQEIEHKYLVRELPALPDDTTVVEIEQGYIPGREIVERLRRVRSVDGEVLRHERTVKLGKGVVRTEIEEEIPAELFARMWPLTDGRRLRKRRHVAQCGRHTWEVDEFLDRDLVLAEVELSDAHEDVDIPEWLAAVLVREVTDEREYTNAVLASGDRRVSEEPEKDLEHEDEGRASGDGATDDARITNQRRLASSSRWRREEPAVSEPPGA